MAENSEVQVVEDAVPPPALKKRATKRGLCRQVSSSPEDQPETQSETQPEHVTDVYSSCVQRSSMFSMMKSRRPLFTKRTDNNVSDDQPSASDVPEAPGRSSSKRKCQGKATSLVEESSASAEEPAESAFSIDDELDDHESSTTDDVSMIRSPSPPPPPTQLPTRRTRFSKSIEKAFNFMDVFSHLMTCLSYASIREYQKSEAYTLMVDGFLKEVKVLEFEQRGYFALKALVKPRTREKDPVTGAAYYYPWVVISSVNTDARSCILSAFCTCKGGAMETFKGELERDQVLSPQAPPVDSPVQQSTTQVVRVRHIDDIHRFSMAKSEMFSSLQMQMAALLGTQADQVGLFLNDNRLTPSDTPLSSRLHLADIISCHIMVRKEGKRRQEEEPGVDDIRVQMQCRNNRQKTSMIIKKFLPFKVMMERYAEKKGRPLDQFNFLFDGEKLTPTMLPSDVDMDTDDTIDVAEIYGGL